MDSPETTATDSEVNLAAQTESSLQSSSSSRTTGTILSLHPRRNYIIRRASNLSKESHIIAANIDRAFLVVSLVHPATNNEFIDRFLVTAEAYHIPVTILLNKKRSLCYS